MTITEKNKSAFKKFGIHASREQLIIQVLKQVKWSMTTTEIAEYLTTATGRQYTTANVSSSMSVLKREKLVDVLPTLERMANNTFLKTYRLAI